MIRQKKRSEGISTHFKREALIMAALAWALALIALLAGLLVPWLLF
ncbi:MAG: hypothetical protein KA790_13725 [Ottowia sp.]|nr:hypothetical protein [Ottowia sp.]HRL36943.1 hypothetical protein [Ottowia beijingensis]